MEGSDFNLRDSMKNEMVGSFKESRRSRKITLTTAKKMLKGLPTSMTISSQNKSHGFTSKKGGETSTVPGSNDKNIDIHDEIASVKSPERPLVVLENQND